MVRKIGEAGVDLEPHPLPDCEVLPEAHRKVYRAGADKGAGPPLPKRAMGATLQLN